MHEATPQNYKAIILNIKRTIAKNFRWSLYEIDETDICSLLEFIHFKPDDDPNIRVINGKEYRRATKAPKWL